MPPTSRSRRQRLFALSVDLRARGWTWARIAARIAHQENVNALVAMRLAHGMSQADVADRWNEKFPSDKAVKTFKTISSWETWPRSGHQPSLDTLGRLARIYQCDVRDLVESEDFGDLDETTLAALSAEPAQAAPASSSGAPDEPSSAQERATSLTPTSGPRLIPGVGRTVPEELRLPDELAALLRHCLTTMASGGIDDGASAHGASAHGVSARRSDEALARLVEVLRQWAQTKRRRETLRLFGWAASTVVTSPVFGRLDADEQARLVGALDDPSRVDEAVIEHIMAALWIAKWQDDTLGPQAALETALAQRNLLRLLLPECPSRMRRRLLSTFSIASRLAGWLCADLAVYEDAEYYYENARLTAHEAENTELGAHALGLMSQLATWRGRPRIGIDHAIAGQAWARRTTDRVLHAYAADLVARAYAADGHYAECMSNFDEAQAFLAQYDGDPTVGVVYDAVPDRCGPAYLTSIRGKCLIQLHRPREGLELTLGAIPEMNPLFVRIMAFTNLDVADACIQIGDIDEAARAIGDAGALTARNHSVRLVRQVLGTWRKLMPWHDTQVVRELGERMTAYGLV